MNASGAATRRVQTRAWFLGAMLLTLIGITLVIGWLDGNHQPGPVPSPVYCAGIGDDNCDGIITPDESGWRCVPPSGGPLFC